MVAGSTVAQDGIFDDDDDDDDDMARTRRTLLCSVDVTIRGDTLWERGEADRCAILLTKIDNIVSSCCYCVVDDQIDEQFAVERLSLTFVSACDTEDNVRMQIYFWECKLKKDFDRNSYLRIHSTGLFFLLPAHK